VRIARKGDSDEKVACIIVLAAAVCGAVSFVAVADEKPNILFIMGDDIGWMQPSIYHRGLEQVKKASANHAGD
jgi:hypothetical protein